MLRGMLVAAACALAGCGGADDEGLVMARGSAGTHQAVNSRPPRATSSGASTPSTTARASNVEPGWTL